MEKEEEKDADRQVCREEDVAGAEEKRKVNGVERYGERVSEDQSTMPESHCADRIEKRAIIKPSLLSSSI